ncbi:MAG: LysR family transcriptional regulator [Mycobacteriaceae bacterium]|uniref:LysR family transcriptional regulator n=1 Tax=Corynebacterium sp. TaxID=1720 RepID=UPI003F977CA0
MTDLDWFIDLADTGNMVDTSLATGISQSALSRRLAKLERRVGTALFDRHGRHLVLNHRGAVLADAASRTRATWHAGVEEVQRMVDPERGSVRLAFMHSLGTWLVPDLLRSYRTTHPTVRFDLVQGAALDLIDQVLAGRADLALVGPRPDAQIRDGQVEWVELDEQRLGLAVPSNHRWAERDTIDFAEAAGEPFVAMLEGYGTRLLLDELAADAGFRPRLVFESMELTTVAGLVTAGLGVALLPLDDPNLRLPGMAVVPLATTRSRELGIVWESGAELVPPVAAFLEFVEGRRGPGERQRERVTR